MVQKTPGRAPDTLPILYAALAGGVFLYAAVLAFVIEPVGSVGNPMVLRVAWLIVAVGVTLLAGVIQQRVVAQRKRGAEGAAGDSAVTNAILVWAMAEGQALVGLTGYLLSGDRLLLILPLVLFAYLFLRHPPAAFRPGG